MEQAVVEACYMCGEPLREGESKLLFSDIRSDCGKRWEMRRYCFGEDTLSCATVTESIRRGALFEVISGVVPYEGEDLDSTDDACDGETTPS
mgnify:CR=1 FL=1|jgi:hypothetical protein